MGLAIIELRHSRGMTQRDLAVAGGISENHVGKLERGEVREPGLAAIAKVALALDRSVAPLVLAFAGWPRPAVRRLSEPRKQMAIAPALALGATLRALRRRADLSQAMLAEEAGLAYPTLSRLEGGKKKDPALTTLVRISSALARWDEAMAADEVLVQLSGSFAGEVGLPNDAQRWLTRRGYKVCNPSIDTKT